MAGSLSADSDSEDHEVDSDSGPRVSFHQPMRHPRSRAKYNILSRLLFVCVYRARLYIFVLCVYNIATCGNCHFSISPWLDLLDHGKYRLRNLILALDTLHYPVSLMSKCASA